MAVKRDSKGRFAGSTGGGSGGGRSKAPRAIRAKISGARKANAPKHAARRAVATPGNGARFGSRASLRSRGLRKSQAAPNFTAYHRNTAKRSKKK